MLLQNWDLYSQQKDSVGQIRQNLYLKILANSVSAKQRPSRVSLQYQEILSCLDQMCISEITREIGINTKIGSEFINPIIILPKGIIVRLFIDAS